MKEERARDFEPVLRVCFFELLKDRCFLREIDKKMVVIPSEKACRCRLCLCKLRQKNIQILYLIEVLSIMPHCRRAEHALRACAGGEQFPQKFLQYPPPAVDRM